MRRGSRWTRSAGGGDGSGRMGPEVVDGKGLYCIESVV